MKKLFLASSLIPVVFLSLVAGGVDADTLDHGGYPERIKGGGDKIPPRCQLGYPAAATAPFELKWNCVDDYTDSADIRTELWIYRKGAQSSEQIANFLGFPAAAFIDESVLRVTTFADGIPVGFRLQARDRAGNQTISPLTYVFAQAASISNCSLNITTMATDSNGGTTGLPAMSVMLDTPEISASHAVAETVVVSTSPTASPVANPCEISTVCSDGNKVPFIGTVKTSNGVATITDSTLVFGPNHVSTRITDASIQQSQDGSLVTSVNLAGSATIDGQPATVTLSCGQ